MMDARKRLCMAGPTQVHSGAEELKLHAGDPVDEEDIADFVALRLVAGRAVRPATPAESRAVPGQREARIEFE